MCVYTHTYFQELWTFLIVITIYSCFMGISSILASSEDLELSRYKFPHILLADVSSSLWSWPSSGAWWLWVLLIFEFCPGTICCGPAAEAWDEPIGQVSTHYFSLLLGVRSFLAHPKCFQTLRLLPWLLGSGTQVTTIYWLTEAGERGGSVPRLLLLYPINCPVCLPRLYSSSQLTTFGASDTWELHPPSQKSFTVWLWLQWPSSKWSHLLSVF